MKNDEKEIFFANSFSVGEKSLFYYSNQLVLKRPTIIFIHGFPDGPDVWFSLAKNFSAEFNIVMPYLPGVHPNCKNTTFMLESFLLECLLLLKELKITDNLFLIGHDIGGVVVDRLSHLLGKKCKGITFINTMGLSLYSENLTWKQILKSWYVPIFSSGLGKKLLDRSKNLGKKLIKKMDETVDERKIPGRLDSIGLYQEFFQSLPNLSKEEKINSIKTLFIFSEDDPFVQIPEKRTVLRYYPHGIIRVVEGGHWEFTKRVKYFYEIINQQINFCGDKNGHIAI